MKRILLALLLPATLMVMSFSGAQTPDANQEQRLLALIKEVQTQQTQMTENQKKIETKLAEIGETVRVARIFAGRSQWKNFTVSLLLLAIFAAMLCPAKAQNAPTQLV